MDSESLLSVLTEKPNSGVILKVLPPYCGVRLKNLLNPCFLQQKLGRSSCETLSRDRTAGNLLTGGVGAHVDDLALGPVDLVLVRGGQLGFHHDGILSPRLQRHDEVTGLRLVLLPFRGSPWGVHVSDHPAVGAAGVLPVKLRHVLERSGDGDERLVWRSLDLLWSSKLDLRLFVEHHEAQQVPEV